ncbi:MAG: aspartate kinase [Ruminococcaceae bacterium]|nr:aspartate kinase [Oscillospiraceae bacterium]
MDWRSVSVNPCFIEKGFSMSLYVQKFGGSSVADAEKLMHISHIIRNARAAGHDVIAVVSAQGDATNRLIEKKNEISTASFPREQDALLAAGEQISAALTAIALESTGVPAVSLLGWQVPLRSDGTHGDARILKISHTRIERELSRGRVVVCAGFQGVDGENDVTTLGRGGSDYSAVALAAAFGAERCLIYTDVDGVYTADPRLCPTARPLPTVSYEDMYALSRAGAQVLHDKCVALAQESGVEPEVLSCAPGSASTRIAASSGSRGLTGVTRRENPQDDYAAVTLVGGALPSLSIEKKAVLALNAAGVPIRGVDAGERTLTLYVDRSASREALCRIHDAVLI